MTACCLCYCILPEQILCYTHAQVIKMLYCDAFSYETKINIRGFVSLQSSRCADLILKTSLSCDLTKGLGIMTVANAKSGTGKLLKKRPAWSAGLLVWQTSVFMFLQTVKGFE